MRVIAPLSRKQLGREGFLFVVARNLDDPFRTGEVISDAQHRYLVVTIEAGSGPREVNLLVKLAP